MDDISRDILFWTPAWLSCLVLLGLLVAAVEGGYRLGERHRLGREADVGLDLTATQGAMLGLLGLLLAFTYSFVASRADARKQAVIHEANAIGTAWLRGGLMPQPHAGEIRELLRQYLDSRLVSHQVGTHPTRLRQALARSDAIQAQLWPAVQRMTQRHPPTPLQAQFVGSINDVLDRHTDRMAAAMDHLPALVLVLLAVVAAASLGLTAYAGGLQARRNRVLTIGLSLLVVAVVFVILDLDHARSGFIRVSQQSLIDLQRDLREATQP